MQVVSAFSPGTSTGVSASVSGKIFSNIKYLNLSYSNQLEEALKTWKSSYLSLGLDFDIPDGLQAELEEGPAPYVFKKYDVSPSFLINFWEPFLVLITLLLIFGMIQILEWIVALKNQSSTSYRVLSKSRILLFNFLLAQAYSLYGDIALFAILEFRSLNLAGSLSSISFIISLALFVLMTFGLSYHIWFLNRYQTLKNSPSDQGLQQFKIGNPGFEILYQDFKDQNLLKQSFLFILTIRDIIFSLILVTLFEHPLAQCIIILTLSIMMLLYLVIVRPFATTSGQIQQIFFEFIIFIVSLSTLILAVMENKGSTSMDSRQRIGKLLIIVNLIFNFSALGFMILQLGLQAWELYKNSRFSKIFPQKKKIRLDPTFTNSAIQLRMDSLSFSHINETQQNIFYNKTNHLQKANHFDSRRNPSKVTPFKPIESFESSIIQAPHTFEVRRTAIQKEMPRREQPIVSDSHTENLFNNFRDRLNEENCKTQQARRDRNLMRNDQTENKKPKREIPAETRQNFHIQPSYQKANRDIKEREINSQTEISLFKVLPNARRRYNI